MAQDYTCSIEESYEKETNAIPNLHKKKFKVEMMSNGVKAIGEGFSKKEATSNGAIDLLRKLENSNNSNKNNKYN